MSYHEAASIQLLPSPLLALASTISTVSLLLFRLARPAVVAKTCVLVAKTLTLQRQPR